MDIVSTFFERHGRRMNVKKTLCALLGDEVLEALKYYIFLVETNKKKDFKFFKQ